MNESNCYNFSLLDNLIQSKNEIIIYEVNLAFQASAFHKKGTWMLTHIKDMVKENDFLGYAIFNPVNIDPLNDEHMRVHEMTVHYYISSIEELKNYFLKQAKTMRNQVIENFTDKYTVWRRVFTVKEEDMRRIENA